LTTLSPSLPGGKESQFQTEQQRFGELFGRLIDAILNSLFDLRPQVATIRLIFLIFLFLLSGLVITLSYYPPSQWVSYLQDVFGYLLVPNYIPIYPDPIADFINFAWQAFTDPRVLQYLPIFLAPFFIAIQTAANYLADVFELEDPSVARHFVRAVALTGSSNTIRVSQGNVIEDHKKLPTYQIGGPGRVVVDMDSAALFEKPDGTPRVIGPTGKLPGGKASLDGFERFRQAIDLRNQAIELRDEDGRSSEILGRSLDGIPISATDVNFLFSVFRDNQQPTTENPYPFTSEAIERLIYKAVSKVTPDREYPYSFDFNWINSMTSLVRSRLGGFMNDHKLAEYLASIGQPEVNQFNRNEDNMVDAVEALARPTENDLPKENKIDERPVFTPRDRLKLELFNLYAEEFSKIQRERGVQLYWVGLGTWRIPVEIVPESKIVPENHLEAWKTSHENLIKESILSQGSYKNEAAIQKFVSLIQEVLVAKSAPTNTERIEAMNALLNAYRLQLIEEAEILKAKGEAVPSVIIQAIECLSDALDIPWKWEGPRKPDSPEDKGLLPGGVGSSSYGSSPAGRRSASNQESAMQRSEEALYNELVLLVGDQAQTNRLIEIEQKNFPKESRRQWILRARDHHLHDRGASTT